MMLKHKRISKYFAQSCQLYIISDFAPIKIKPFQKINSLVGRIVNDFGWKLEDDERLQIIAFNNLIREIKFCIWIRHVQRNRFAMGNSFYCVNGCRCHWRSNYNLFLIMKFHDSWATIHLWTPVGLLYILFEIFEIVDYFGNTFDLFWQTSSHFRVQILSHFDNFSLCLKQKYE